MTEVRVDHKNRIVLPKELRESLGIVPGSMVNAEYRGGAIILVPKVPVKGPTQALWGLAMGIIEDDPKKVARRAIAKRSKLGR